LGFPSFGCIPAQITIFGALGQQTCVEEQNAVAMAYNLELQAVAIPKLKASLPGLELLYLDAYSLIYDMFNNPSKYGTQHELYFSDATCGWLWLFAEAFFFWFFLGGFG
jgi:hypothetical protein